ncbi:hypothetical protein K1719_013887 [Acacia pycnantha]|nr:hypothetical protein K1719_013887 [Acacia pycnantha]
MTTVVPPSTTPVPNPDFNEWLFIIVFVLFSLCRCRFLPIPFPPISPNFPASCYPLTVQRDASVKHQHSYGVVVTKGQAQILTMNGDAMIYPRTLLAISGKLLICN